MGRPIKSKYFGTAKGSATGGEGVSSVTIATGGSGLTGTNTVVFSAPDLPGGATATGTVNLSGANTVTSVTITSAGSGYTSEPSVVFVGTLGTTATGSAVLSTSVSNVIKCRAYIPVAAGGTSAVLGDIDEQVASKKYRVQTAEGTGPCRLVASSTLTAGTMNILATDTNGSTYYVKKLTSRRAILVQSTASGSFVFADGAAAGWTLGSASSGVVSIENF
jgi:hypothetical protein